MTCPWERHWLHQSMWEGLVVFLAGGLVGRHGMQWGVGGGLVCIWLRWSVLCVAPLLYSAHDEVWWTWWLLWIWKALHFWERQKVSAIFYGGSSVLLEGLPPRWWNFSPEVFGQGQDLLDGVNWPLRYCFTGGQSWFPFVKLLQWNEFIVGSVPCIV